MKKTLVYTAIPKILVLLSTGYATLMMLHWSIGFTFFTQLSNWYCAAAVGCQLLILWKNRAKNLALQDSPPAAYHRFLYILKYSALVSILLTFLVYLCFLAHSPSVPRFDSAVLLSALSAPPWSVRFSLGGDNRMMAPYPFLNYSAPAGWFGYMPETAGYTSPGTGVFYLVILLVWLLAVLILRIAVFCIVLFQRRKIVSADRDKTTRIHIQ